MIIIKIMNNKSLLGFKRINAFNSRFFHASKPCLYPKDTFGKILLESINLKKPNTNLLKVFSSVNKEEIIKNNEKI